VHLPVLIGESLMNARTWIPFRLEIKYLSVAFYFTKNCNSAFSYISRSSVFSYAM